MTASEQSGNRDDYPFGAQKRRSPALLYVLGAAYAVWALGLAWMAASP